MSRLPPGKNPKTGLSSSACACTGGRETLLDRERDRFVGRGLVQPRDHVVAIGVRRRLPLARAGIAVGADGLMVEVHHAPDKALSDGAQSLFPDQFVELMDEVSQIATAVHRALPRAIKVAEPTRL